MTNWTIWQIGDLILWVVITCITFQYRRMWLQEKKKHKELRELTRSLMNNLGEIGRAMELFKQLAAHDKMLLEQLIKMVSDLKK